MHTLVIIFTPVGHAVVPSCSPQMWAQSRVWPTTEDGIPCTGPAPVAQLSPATPSTRAVEGPLTGKRWSGCQKRTTRTSSSLMSVRSKSLPFPVPVIVFVSARCVSSVRQHCRGCASAHMLSESGFFLQNTGL